MRSRISITIKNDLLKEVDALVDGVKIRNRSHSFEVLLEKALSRSMPPVYVLAGEAEKCMRRLKGKPVLQHTLELLRAQGFDRVTIAVVGEEVRKYFGDGKGLGLEIDYVRQKGLVGTAKALVEVKDKIKETFLVVYGDNFFDFDLKDLVGFHRKEKKTGTVALTTSGRPGDYGVINLKGNSVVGFNEKPTNAKSYLVSTGIFVFEPGIFEHIGNAKSLEKEVLAKLVEKGALSGYVAEGLWASGESESEIRKVERLI